MSTGRPLQLVVEISSGHRGVYRVLEGTQKGVLDRLVERTQRAEEAGFLAAFLFDGTYLEPVDHDPNLGLLEPLTVLSALSQVTSSIGLVPTISTTFWDPFNFARLIATLDHVSGGRAGWNAVTSFQGERNFGYDVIPEPDQRYERAREFVDVVRALLSSWEDGVYVRRDGRVVPDPSRIRRIDHRGKFFSVEGPLGVPRTPQGWPVFFQSGGSSVGTDFGAEYGEAVYVATPTVEQAEEAVLALRERAAVHRRAAGLPLIMTSLNPKIGLTDANAKEAEQKRISELDFDAGRRYLERHLGIADLSQFELDEVIPAELFPTAEEIKRRPGRFEVFRRLAVDERKTLKDLIVYTDYVGHWREVGTPQTIADKIEARYRRGLLDILTVSSNDPQQEDLIYDALVPELAKRGIYDPTPARGLTLRERIGLPSPLPS